MYEIWFKDENNNNIMICKLTAIPHVNESIYFPHRGLYTVKDVVYNISDDSPYDDNKIMYIMIILDKINKSIYN